MLSKMWKTWNGKLLLSIAAITLIMAAVAIAADEPQPPADEPGMTPPPGAPGEMGPGGPGGPGGQRGARGMMNPEEMQKRRMEQIKSALQLADDKWKTAEPLLKKAMDLNMELRGGMFGMGRRGPNAEQNAAATPAAPVSEIATKTAELKKLVGDAAATEDAIKAKIAELTAAKDKVKAELATVKTELCKQLTAKQQASLILLGNVID